MKSEVPLTPEQRLFAEEHHNLVYKFLKENHLSGDEFYDVVIFGYLRAVSRYFTEPELQQYSFTTIAWRRMSACISDYRRKQRRPKHNADIVSLHIKQNEDSLPLEETIAASNPYMRQLEEQLLLHDLAKRVSRQQMNIVRLKSCGYNDRDIARCQNTTMKRVQELLEEVRSVLLEICYG
ncbi:MAG: sigma-70 family RNA polymerase sigma factor [Lachnospiraceae bacterium]|nr:sigma-70 family RNA polymerase sigma factor [Lachnospiraceae bacterium]